MLHYALITPARNEERYIECALESVCRQSVTPKLYLVILDNSLDQTEEIVLSYKNIHPFIRLFHFNGDAKRNFGSKARAFNFGLRLLDEVEKVDFIGNLDADITLPPDYYKSIIRKFEMNPSLGIAAGFFFEMSGNRLLRTQDDHALSPFGGVQLFRRKCIIEIAGYREVSTGGIDSLAEFCARQKGWQTMQFSDISLIHNRKAGTASVGILFAKYRTGVRDYHIGYHPLFFVVKCIRRLADTPYIIGSIARLIGFFSCMFRRSKIPIDRELVAFIRKEQIHRLCSALRLSRS
jgi:glycosyltransferase involved in cell wall biosynthesis